MPGASARLPIEGRGSERSGQLPRRSRDCSRIAAISVTAKILRLATVNGARVGMVNVCFGDLTTYSKQCSTPGPVNPTPQAPAAPYHLLVKNDHTCGVFAARKDKSVSGARRARANGTRPTLRNCGERFARIAVLGLGRSCVAGREGERGPPGMLEFFTDWRITGRFFRRIVDFFLHPPPTELQIFSKPLI